MDFRACGARRRGTPTETLRRYYQRLIKELGPQGWWPARTRLEIILGAILTQNTTWHNAALALAKLRKAGLLRLARLREASLASLESSIRPAGFYRQKARAIQNVLHWLDGTHGGSLTSAFARPIDELRHQLLAINGVGPETADAILLYAGRRPIFVADAYTRRVLGRHELVAPAASYSTVQQFLHAHLPADHALFNEFHALLVSVGKSFCKRQVANCEGCPLETLLPRPWEGQAETSRLNHGLRNP
jgi:endonuclease III related protein